MAYRAVLFFNTVIKNRYLLRQFVIRDIKGRFAASVIGILWAFLSPLATMISYIFVFSLVMRISISADETGTSQFSLFFLAGFFPWTLFSESINKSSRVLIDNAGLITKVLFPTELLPVSSVLSSFLTGGIGFLIFLFYLSLHGFLHISWALLPLLLMLLFVFALGIAFFISALHVFLRDVGELLNILMMLWFFGTPIIYPASMLPDSLKMFLSCNPMLPFISLF
ncbi:MAG: ABC transporter permease, partial [Desulfamplus sp.]|nr:ABC transporter permease [Desulfamplus sp.]